MSTYAEKLKDPRWQKKRLEIMNRDGFSCHDCREDKKQLHVHHCAYAGRDPWNTPDSSLITVCVDCHKIRQELEDDAHLMLGQIMARMANLKEEDESLEGFIQEMSILVGNPDASPAMVDRMQYDWDSETRWYQHALSNSEFRDAFETVTGRKPRWGKSP